MSDITLYRDPSLATGLAAAPGDGRTEVTDVAGLPEHRVEVHAFTSHALAVAFVEGFQLAGGNAVACHREAESTMGKLVVVAFLSEDRDPEAETIWDAVRVVGHRHSGEEGRIIARHLEKTSAERREAEERRAAVVRPLLDVMRTAGFEPIYDFNTGHSVRIGFGEREAWCAARPAEGGLWRVSIEVHDHNGYFGEREPDGQLVLLLEEFGLDRLDYDEAAFAPVSLDQAPALITRAREFWQRAKVVILAIWRERAAVAEAEKQRRKREAANAKARQRRASALG